MERSDYRSNRIDTAVRRLGRAGLAFLAAVLFFLITAAPGGGGRGGGGHGGGFGGGRGFGGGGLGYPLGVPSRHLVGGRLVFDGWAHLDPEMRRSLLCVLGVTAAATTGLLVSAICRIELTRKDGRRIRFRFRFGPQHRHRRAHLVFRLQRAERYLPALDELMRGARFLEQRQNRQVLGTLAELLQEGDVVQGDITYDTGLGSRDDAARGASGLFWSQMLSAGLRCTVSRLPERAAAAAVESCVIGVVVSLHGGSRQVDGRRTDAVRELRRMAGYRSIDAVYLYYAPEPGVRMTQSRAAALYRKLRDAAHQELHAG